MAKVFSQLHVIEQFLDGLCYGTWAFRVDQYTAVTNHVQYLSNPARHDGFA